MDNEKKVNTVSKVPTHVGKQQLVVRQSHGHRQGLDGGSQSLQTQLLGELQEFFYNTPPGTPTITAALEYVWPRQSLIVFF